MKKLIILALGCLIFTACDNIPTKVDNPKQFTTIEMRQLAASDTNYYKIIEKDNHLYVLKDNLVIRDCKNDSGDRIFFGVSLLICLFIFLVVIILMGFIN